MTKNPCYFIVAEKNGEEVMTAICLDCSKNKNISGWYWDKDFNEADDYIGCHFCQKTIFSRESNNEENKTTI